MPSLDFMGRFSTLSAHTDRLWQSHLERPLPSKNELFVEFSRGPQTRLKCRGE